MPDSFYINLAYNFIWQNQAILLRNKHTHTCWINKSIVDFFFNGENSRSDWLPKLNNAVSSKPLSSTYLRWQYNVAIINPTVTAIFGHKRAWKQ